MRFAQLQQSNARTNPESLCARGRYFHDGEFTSTRKKHSSHTWRAMLAGREVLSQDLIKRIGDGSSTKIWHDQWIPNHFQARPLTPEDGQVVSRVSDLVLANGQWDVNTIRQWFIPVDAAAILRIQLRPQFQDIWSWEPDKYGLYSVKSAYKLIDTERTRDAQLNTASVSGNEVWEKIWKVQIPPKVRVFWWRVIHEFLPARQHQTYGTDCKLRSLWGC